MHVKDQQRILTEATKNFIRIKATVGGQVQVFPRGVRTNNVENIWAVVVLAGMPYVRFRDNILDIGQSVGMMKDLSDLLNQIS